MFSLYHSSHQKRLLALCALFLFSCGILSAADGDTIRVSTVKFGDTGPKQAGKFLFPPAGNSYRKVLMNYKLRCPPGKPCGEWDYLMYVYLNHPSGRLDSTLMPGPSFTVNGATSATFSYIEDGMGWKYTPRFEKQVVREQTLREGTTNKDGQRIDSIGFINLSSVSAYPFNTSITGGRAQYLWTAQELRDANVLSGAITGMQFYVTKAGSGVQRLTVRMKNTSLSALTPSSVQESGFTTVFERNYTMINGQVSLPFTQAFTWDGTSNVVVDIVQNNVTEGEDTEVAGVMTGYSNLVQDANASDVYAQFDGTDYIITNDKATIKTGTVEARFMAADTNGQHYILSNDRDAGTDFPGYHLYLNGGKLNAAIWRESDNQIMTISGGKVSPGQWYHAAMTFDGTTLILYIDGQEVARAATSPTTIKTPAYNLMIGVLGFEAPNYYRFKGGIDNVRIWNSVLSAQTLRDWMYGDVNEHPEKSSLVASYAMDEGSGFEIKDAAKGKRGYFQAGKGNWRRYTGREYFSRMLNIDYRPWTLFEQGDYVSRVDSVLVVDSVAADPVYVIQYNDFTKPGKATDTLVVWTPYYRYTYDSKGKVIDSTLTPAGGKLFLSYHPYYGEPFEVIERYELMRYITPYGNGLNLGDGFTWTMDITDYAPLLHDSVSIEAFNPQEDLELTFDMILGTPAREVVDIQPLWLGNPGYGLTPSIESFLTPKKAYIAPEARAAKLRVIQTGHGFGSEGNCAEFCDKQHFIKVGGTQRFSRHVWRNTCGLNPVYPQGGTWLYNRTNWCPGAEVTPYDYELTPFITPGDSALIDVDMEAYTYPGGGSQPYYAFSGVLFTYGDFHFTHDAAVEHIIAPTMEDIYRRQNPTCGSPVIVIRNNGSQPLTSLEIEYGVKGAGKTSFMWSGNIPPLGEQEVTLLAYNDWDKADADNLFEVWLKTPNGASDEYAVDNYAYSHFEKTPVYYNDIEIRLRTNKFATDQYEWTLRKSDGQLIKSASNLNDNTLYVDSLHLDDGCYEFRLINKLGYGLDFWAMREQLGSGSLSFTSLGSSMKTFGSDFGSEIYHQFRVGPKPTIAVSEDTLDFGFVEKGKAKQMTVEVTPVNAEGLTVERTSVFLPNRGFELVSTEPSLESGPVVLKAGEKMTVTVAFKPTKDGAHTATLSVGSNDQRNSTVSIPLRGTGTDVVSVGDESGNSAPIVSLTAAPTIFTDESLVSFAVDVATPVQTRLVVVNSIGQEMVVLFDGPASSRTQTVTLSGKTFAAGVYYIVMHTSGVTTAVPVTIVR